MRYGHLSGPEASMVAQSISTKGTTNIHHIENLFNAAREHAKRNSQAMQKFETALEDHSKLICQNLEK